MVSTLAELEDLIALLDPTTALVPGGERIRRGHTNGPIRVALPEGYLDHLDDLTVPDDEAEMAVVGRMTERPHVVLASGSPRRRELLAQLGVVFTMTLSRRRRDPLVRARDPSTTSTGWRSRRPSPSMSLRRPSWSPPTRPSTSAGRSSANPSTPTMPAPCSVACRHAPTVFTPASLFDAVRNWYPR